MKTLCAILALSFITLSAEATITCNLNPRYLGDEIRWDSPPGTVQFSVQEIIEGLPPVYLQTRLNSHAVDHRVSAQTTIRYIITAEIASGTQAIESMDACMATIDVTLEPDAAFRAMVRKAVIPIAGSTAGAFGGKFRTSLELRGSGAMRGRVVFHPAGRVASESDPSLPYTFTSSNPSVAWDDVVEAMGQSGLGSLDIIPDDTSVDTLPQIVARLYNDTNIGTFGTEVAAVLPYHYVGGRSLEVPIPNARFRTNIGIRTFGETKVKVVTYAANGKLEGFRDVTFPAGWTMMTTAADLSRETLTPGASVTLLVSGPAVAFYTITENQTNDPTVIVAPSASQSRNVGLFVD
ncbi:MAG TPA: hypothetical protein VHW00_17910 [Thermoanaerobaculia bacterium]|nr:hypothetical protein [Thermoanaerobaculia bacterium]